jgi:predicted lipoprotein
MRIRRRLVTARTAAAILALAVFSCGGSGPLVPGPRRTMLRDLAENVFLPTYERLAVETEALADAAAAFEIEPSLDTLSALRDAWRRARAVWKQSEAFAIGPAQTLRTAAKIDWTPVRPERIETTIAGGAGITADDVADLGANVKGFLALEYVLFDPQGGDDAVLEQMGDARRRAFVRAVAANMRDETAELRDAWEPEGGDFAAELANAGRESAAFASVKSAVDELVNQLIFTGENVADAQLLAALGPDGVPNSAALDAHRSENGPADVLDELAGIQNVYFGSTGGHDGTGFSDVVAEIAPDVDRTIALAIRRSLETASRIPVPLEDAVADERDLVERAQVRAKELMRRLEIDLVSVLGTTLRFNPGDGD